MNSADDTYILDTSHPQNLLDIFQRQEHYFCLACDEVGKARHRYYSAGDGEVNFASKFSALVHFSVTTYDRTSLFGPHVHHRMPMSVWHMPHDLDLIFMVHRLHQNFLSSSFSQYLPRIGQAFLVCISIIGSQCQSDTCHLALTSFSWFIDSNLLQSFLLRSISQ